VSGDPATTITDLAQVHTVVQHGKLVYVAGDSGGVSA
jgi:hypothetical protein